MSGKKSSFVNISLRGLGQIMLQENRITGLLFLAGIFYGSLLMGIAAIVSVICGTVTARLMNFDRTETEKGLYGFSPALVGIALILFFKPVFIIWLAIILGSGLAALVQHWFIKKKIPVFTLPFVLVTWGIIYFFQVVYPAAPAVISTANPAPGLNFALVFRGFGQVIFQGSVLAGSLFFIGVLINSPVSALYGLIGSALGGIFALWLSAPAEAVAMGLFSYNAVLCAIVFAGNKFKDVVWALASVVLSVIISRMMYQYNLVQLTFPFVAATCICLAARNTSELAFAQPKHKQHK